MGDNKIPIIEKIIIDKKYPSNDKLLKQGLDIVKKFIVCFQNKSPLSFMYEADIQGMMANELKRVIMPITFATEGIDLEKIKYLSLINCEYPVKKRFDIACIDPQKIEMYVDWKKELKDTGINTIFWELPVLFALEIKYCLYGYNTGKDQIIKDVEKLRDYDDSYHTERNQCTHLIAPSLKIQEDFKFLSLLFYQDSNKYKIHKDKLKGTPLSEEIGPILEWSSLLDNPNAPSYYMISHDEVCKIDLKSNSESPH